ncbi:MAG: transcriptional repressor, partial [Thermodesulfobacteriaceae bacterium]|nr:transcriptional repressor [Thermodesulfobacteriaceae bacterium]
MEAIKSADLKMTPQRLKLIEIIDEIGEDHPTIGEILKKIRKDFPTTSFSTLYTNILVFKELGLLKLFSIEDEARIELNLKPHFNICDLNIRDYENEELLRKIEEEIGKKVELVIVITERGLN